MIFEMKLADSPFDKIKRGEKTVEIRLFDEKRKQISEGDIISFSRINGQETIKAKVMALYKFPTFNALFETDLFLKTGCGEISVSEAVESMRQYYTKEQEDEYGVLGIEVALTK